MLFLLYGEAIRTRIEKLNTSDTVTTQTVRPVDTNIKLQNKTVFSETELKSMDTAQLQNIVQTLSDDFAKSWKAAGLDPVAVDKQVSEMTRQTDTAELIKSAQIMQDELGFGEVFDQNSDGLQSDFGDDIMKANESTALFEEVENDQFIILDWTDYPNGPKPNAPFRLLYGDEYINARKAADKANRALHKTDPNSKGLDYHEIHPVKFDGSPTDVSNKILLTRKQHAKFTAWWNNIQRQIENQDSSKE